LYHLSITLIDNDKFDINNNGRDIRYRKPHRIAEKLIFGRPPRGLLPYDLEQLNWRKHMQ